jgi:hypothetical protein
LKNSFTGNSNIREVSTIDVPLSPKSVSTVSQA